MEELLPCPFCGGHDLGEFVGRDLLYHVMCRICRADVSADRMQEVRVRWNRRVQPEQPDVAHGRWIEHIDSYENYCECSVCHYIPDAPLDETPHCPSCGAKMREAR